MIFFYIMQTAEGVQLLLGGVLIYIPKDFPVGV